MLVAAPVAAAGVGMLAGNGNTARAAHDSGEYPKKISR
jgi:hypothetical protein